MLKKCIVSSFLILCLLFPALSVNCSAMDISARSAVVINGENGNIAYEKNAHARMGMASTTKIMTAITALENCDDINKTVSIDDRAIGIEGSSIYMKKGEKLTMKELLYALLLQSANDAAAAIAYEVSGSIEGFAELMNEKANGLGLKDTHFTNPHGLYDEDHYTTAYELALITKHALSNPLFREIVSTKKATITQNNGEGKRVLVNHNKLLSLYEGCIGVKTGFTKKTGRCLVSAAEKDGTLSIAVTLNAPNDWQDHKKLLDKGFDTFATYHLASPEQYSFRLSVVGSETNYIQAKNAEGLKYTCQKQDSSITKEIILDRFLFAPINKGDKVGQVIFYNQGKEIGRIDLVADKNAPVKKVKKKLFGIF